MGDPYPNAKNVAGGQAAVGFQAETVHGDVFTYVIGPDASAEDKYQVGINYLDGGVPSEALPLIERAIAEGHDTSEVRFFWLLALISGRTSRQLSQEDTTRLDRFRKNSAAYHHGPWADGIRVILCLLDSLREPRSDPAAFILALDDLHPPQRDPVLRHLAVFLKGPLGDQVWKFEHQAALDGRHARSREERIGLFFQPSPARPRARQSVPAEIYVTDMLTALTATTVCLIALIDIGWQLLRDGSIAGMLGYVLGCVGCCVAAAKWTEFRWQVRRRTEHERLIAPAVYPEAPSGGFAARVDDRFDHYFAVRVPHGTNRAEWLTGTAGVRRLLRDELVEIYREQRVKADQLDWLIRHEVQEVARRWKAGRSYLSDDEFDAERQAGMARVVGGVAAMALGGFLVVWTLLHLDLVGGLTALVVLAASGYHAERRWIGIALKRRWAAADHAESERKYAEREAAYKAWINKLSEIKPSDQDMAAWLDCDKKVILERALRHYGLKRSDVISYAFLDTPSASYSRARVRNGPWRYTQYKIVVFLLTKDGIRQIAYSLRTRDSDIEDLDRESYGYDAIASVQASAPRGDNQQTFDLHLMSGRTISFRVADPVTPSSPENSDADNANNATQDATGLRNTLRVLEGIAADGKGWIERETQVPDSSERPDAPGTHHHPSTPPM